MAGLTHSFEFNIKPLPPYDFQLTVHKPAGWALFTPFEIYGGNTIWTATHFNRELAGVKLSFNGDREIPSITAVVYSAVEIPPSRRDSIMHSLIRTLGADQDLKEFYRFASGDIILKHVIKDLNGMHDTFSPTIFSEAVLAILLQMAPLKRSNEMMASFIQNYGEIAEFDGKRVASWPKASLVANVAEEELKRKCNVGYRAKFIIRLAGKLSGDEFPSAEQLHEMTQSDAKKLLMSLPGIGEYSADIINPHGGFPIDVWSAEVFGKLFFGRKPENNRAAVETVKMEGIRRWGRWAWMAFLYVVQDLPGLSDRLGLELRIT